MSHHILSNYMNMNVTRLIQSYTISNYDEVKNEFQKRLQGALYIELIRRSIGNPDIVTPHFAMWVNKDLYDPKDQKTWRDYIKVKERMKGYNHSLEPYY